MVILCEEYPGTQSIFMPADGIAQECMTSLEEAKMWSLISIGIEIAPEAWSLIMLVTPFFKGRY